MSSPPPSSSHPPPPHSDVPAVLSPAEITAALRDIATAVQEIHLYLAGPYGPPPAAAPAATTGLLLLTWPSQPLVGPVAAVASLQQPAPPPPDAGLLHSPLPLSTISSALGVPLLQQPAAFFPTGTLQQQQ